jgi:SAM-dependent methyltransferase
VGPASRVLDLCCGVGGPGNLVSRATGCELIGLDLDLAALTLARSGSMGTRARFVAAAVPALPLRGPFDVVLLVETFLAFPDKQRLLTTVAGLLAPGGRLAFTVEEGSPLSAEEGASIPGGGTVWPVELGALEGLLAGVGLTIRSLVDHTEAHAGCARRLHDAFAADRAHLAAALGERSTAELLLAHERWIEWLGSRRIRKLAVVCERLAKAPAAGRP